MTAPTLPLFASGSGVDLDAAPHVLVVAERPRPLLARLEVAAVAAGAVILSDQALPLGDLISTALGAMYARYSQRQQDAPPLVLSIAQDIATLDPSLRQELQDILAKGRSVRLFVALAVPSLASLDLGDGHYLGQFGHWFASARLPRQELAAFSDDAVALCRRSRGDEWLYLSSATGDTSLERLSAAPALPMLGAAAATPA